MGRGSWCAAAAVLSLAAAGAGADQYTFFTIGDWGDGSDRQNAVADSMARWAERVKPSFVFALGDNIYHEGVQSPTDSLWASRYESVYTHEALAEAPWFSILGNHDYYGGHPEAEIEYFKQQLDPSKRWVMPDFYYTKTFAVGGNRTMQIVFIDTVPLAGDQFHLQLQMDHVNGDVAMFAMPKLRGANKAFEARGAPQLEWLNRTLASSTADWLLVAGHYPVFSASRHGDSQELIEVLKPMLEAHGVQAYLSGHDHTLQYLAENDVNYFVSGGGGAHLYPLRSSSPQMKFAQSTNGFMVHQFSADGSAMTVSIVGREGDVLFAKEVALGSRGGGAAAPTAPQT